MARYFDLSKRRRRTLKKAFRKGVRALDALHRIGDWRARLRRAFERGKIVTTNSRGETPLDYALYVRPVGRRVMDLPENRYYRRLDCVGFEHGKHGGFHAHSKHACYLDYLWHKEAKGKRGRR